MNDKRMEYANKCLRYFEVVSQQWKVKFVDDECIGSGGKRPDPGTCYPGNGIELTDLVEKEPRSSIVADACTGSLTIIGSFDDVPGYLDEIGDRSEFTIPEKYKTRH